MLGLPERTENGTEPYRNAAMLVPAMARVLGVEPTERKKDSKTGEWVDRPSCSKDALKPYKEAAAVELLMEVRDLDCTLKEVKWLQRDAEISSGRIHPKYEILGAETGRTTTKAQLGQGSKKRNVPSDTAVYKSGKRKGQPRDEKLPAWGFNFQGLTGRSKAALGTGNDDTVLLDVDWTSQEIGCRPARGSTTTPASGRSCSTSSTCIATSLARCAAVRSLTRTPRGKPSASPPTSLWPTAAVLNHWSGRCRRCVVLTTDQVRARRHSMRGISFTPSALAQMKRFKGTNLTECRSVSGRRVRKVSKTAGPDGLVVVYPLSPQKGVNYPIQASGRDLLADALGDLWPALDRFPGAHVVGLIHDEVLLEVPRRTNCLYLSYLKMILNSNSGASQG